MKTVSAGVLMFDSQDRILLGHATGNAHWDIPKGKIEEGEDPIDAALREVWEETGIVLQKEDLIDLGRFKYTPKKDLHLFCVCSMDWSMLNEVGHLKCQSFTEKGFPEMDAYTMAGYGAAKHLVATSMRDTLFGDLDAFNKAKSVLTTKKYEGIRKEVQPIHNPFKRGDIVKVHSMPDANSPYREGTHPGWDNVWISDMDSTVGKTGFVYHIDDDGMSVGIEFLDVWVDGELIDEFRFEFPVEFIKKAS